MSGLCFVGKQLWPTTAYVFPFFHLPRYLPVIHGLLFLLLAYFFFQTSKKHKLITNTLNKLTRKGWKSYIP